MAAGGEGRRNVAIARDEPRRAGFGDPQLRHFAVPLLAAEWESLDVDVAESVFLCGLLGVRSLSVGLREILVRGAIALIGTHLEDVITRLRARDTHRDGV